MKVHRYFFNRGSKSRNKVAVGEPAAGSFSDDQNNNNKTLLSRFDTLSGYRVDKQQTPTTTTMPLEKPGKRLLLPALLEARLSQRVAMDDLASYFVEERSKVR